MYIQTNRIAECIQAVLDKGNVRAALFCMLMLLWWTVAHNNSVYRRSYQRICDIQISVYDSESTSWPILMHSEDAQLFASWWNYRLFEEDGGDDSLATCIWRLFMCVGRSAWDRFFWFISIFQLFIISFISFYVQLFLSFLPCLQRAMFYSSWIFAREQCKLINSTILRSSKDLGRVRAHALSEIDHSLPNNNSILDEEGNSDQIELSFAS